MVNNNSIDGEAMWIITQWSSCNNATLMLDKEDKDTLLISGTLKDSIN